MSSATKSINHRKTKAIDALLSHPSVEAASRASGLSRATLWRYLSDSSFQQDLEARRTAAFATTLERLQSSASSAVDVLQQQLQSEDPSIQISAAHILLRQAEKAALHLTLGRRLHRAESAIQKLEKPC